MMTPAPDADAEDRPQSGMRGSSQTGVRLYNERLVMSLVRTHGSLPKAEIARLTGLSPQTVSVIVRQLGTEGLLVKGRSLKGKVGQPLQPFSLNPEGTFSIGLKVGGVRAIWCWSAWMALCASPCTTPIIFPTPEEFMRFARLGIDELLADLSPQQRQRISGMGVAAPFDIWKWEEEVGRQP